MNLQSLIGLQKQEMDTPTCCVDLDLMEANLAKLASEIQAFGKGWRPHVKCHKTAVVAHRQRAAGAIGFTCAKLGEAEALADAGLDHFLVANQVVGEKKLQRAAALSRTHDLILAYDHFAQVEPLSRMCKTWGVTCSVVIEVDIGFQRAGTKPGRDTLQLAQAISRLPNIKLAGIMGYEGHLLGIADPDEKQKKILDALDLLGHCRYLMLQDGLPCEIVSAGGTGSYRYASTSQAITEIQAGGGIFGDPMYRNLCHVSGFEYALTMLVTITSRPTLDRAIIDAGRKTMSPDIHMPVVKGHPDAELLKLSAEHGILRLGPQSRDLKIGDKIEVVVGYADLTTVLHDHFYAFRNNRLEAIWPIIARDRLR